MGHKCHQKYQENQIKTWEKMSKTLKKLEKMIKNFLKKGEIWTENWPECNNISK